MSRSPAPSSRPQGLSGAPLTGRGLAALALGAGLVIAGSVMGRIELTVFGVALLALVIGGWLSLRLAGRVVDVDRALATDVASVGGLSHVEARLQLSARPVPGGTWRDALPDSLRAVRTESSSGATGELPPGGRGTLHVSYAVVGIRRGRHAVGPLQTAAIDPFGLARRRMTIGHRTPVTIVPAVVALPSLPGSPGAVGSSQLTTGRHGQGADNLIPRPYAPGDSMRRIHWRASAHHGSLMVREEERETTPHALVVFDRGAARWGGTAAHGGDPGFEAAVTLVVSAAWSLARDGYSVSVMDSDGAPIGIVDSHEDMSDLLVAFASVSPRGENTLGRLASSGIVRSAAPVILICGHLTVDDVTGFGSVAAQSSRAVLLSAHPEPGALERAERSGWRTARLTPDVERSWGIATQLTGVAAAASAEGPEDVRVGD